MPLDTTVPIPRFKSFTTMNEVQLSHVIQTSRVISLDNLFSTLPTTLIIIFVIFIILGNTHSTGWALVCLYTGKSTGTLDSFRFSRLQKKVATNNASVHPKVLPPTSTEATYLRVFHQVQEWKGRKLNPLNVARK